MTHPTFSRSSINQIGQRWWWCQRKVVFISFRPLCDITVLIFRLACDNTPDLRKATFLFLCLFITLLGGFIRFSLRPYNLAPARRIDVYRGRGISTRRSTIGFALKGNTVVQRLTKKE